VTFTFPDGRTVGRLGFGAMRLRGADRPGDIALLRRAVELGVTHIDTARMYGNGHNEELIAAALAPYPDDLLIATKGGIEPDGGWYRNDGSPEALRRHVRESLRRLRVERLDLYYLHEPDPSVPIVASVAALAELRDEGAIARLGLSNVTVDQLSAALEVTDIAAVQNRYSAWGGGDDAVLDLTRDRGIAFVPWGPLRDGPPDESQSAGQWSTAQRALRFLLDRSPNMLPIPGTSSITHLEENMAAVGPLGSAPVARHRPG
jgi:pyridoxine 4-dehydrogenase